MSDENCKKSQSIIRWATLSTVLFIIALTALFFSEVIFQDRQFGHRDDCYFYMPLFEQVQSSWNKGEIPLWDTSENLGQPLLANATSSVFYPLKLVYFLPALLPDSLSFTTFTCFKIYTLVHVLLAAFGMLALMRYWRFSRMAALIAALGFTFAGTVFYQYCNTIYLVGMAWFPFAILCGDRLIKSPSIGRLLLLALVLALIIFGGEPQTVYLAGLLLIMLAFFYKKAGLLDVLPVSADKTAPSEKIDSSENAVPVQPRWLLTRRLTWLAGAALCAILLTSIQLIPTAEYAHHSDRTIYDMPESVWDVPPLSLWEVPGYAAKWIRYPSDKIPQKIAKNRPESMTTGILNGLFCRTIKEQGHPSLVYNFSINPWAWTELLWPHLGGNVNRENSRWFERFPNDSLWYATVYMGILPLLLGLISLRFTVGKQRQYATFLPGRSPRRILAVWLSWSVVLAFLASIGGMGPYWFFRALTGAKDLTISNGDPIGSVSWFLNVFLPGYVNFRYPAKIGFIVTFGIAVLAGIGWDALRRKRRLHRLIKFFFGITVVFIAVVALAGEPLFEIKNVTPTSYGPYSAAAAWNQVMFALLHAAIVLVLVDFFLCGKWNLFQEHTRGFLALGRRTGSVMMTALIVLLGADLYYANQKDILTVPASIYTKESGLANKIHEEEKIRKEKAAGNIADKNEVEIPPRIIRFGWYPLDFAKNSSPERFTEIVEWDRQSLLHKYHIDLGVQNIMSPGTMFIDEYSFFSSWYDMAVRSADITPYLAFFDCRYCVYPLKHATIDPTPMNEVLQHTSSSIEKIEAYQGKNQELLDARNIPVDVTLWKIKLPTRRIKIFHDEPALDIPVRTILDQVDSGKVDNRLESEEARFIQYGSNRLELAVKLTRPGDIVLAEQYFPGWQATLFPKGDSTGGKPVEIKKTLGFMRRVSLDPGEYRLVMEYRPVSFYIGAMISGITLLLVLIIGTGLSFRRKRYCCN